jgi:CheY-like chemotaxis protein
VNILIADDNADIRAMLNAAFTIKGHSVTQVADGLEVLEAAKLQQFDALILDIGMPNMDGWQATQLVRQMPDYSTVPIVLFTGYYQYYDEPKAKQVGATLLLQKPLDAVNVVALTVAFVLIDREDSPVVP